MILDDDPWTYLNAIISAADCPALDAPDVESLMLAEAPDLDELPPAAFADLARRALAGLQAGLEFPVPIVAGHPAEIGHPLHAAGREG